MNEVRSMSYLHEGSDLFVICGFRGNSRHCGGHEGPGEPDQDPSRRAMKMGPMLLQTCIGEHDVAATCALNGSRQAPSRLRLPWAKMIASLKRSFGQTMSLVRGGFGSMQAEASASALPVAFHLSVPSWRGTLDGKRCHRDSLRMRNGRFRRDEEHKRVCVCVEGRALIAFSPHGHLGVVVDAGVRRLCSRLGIDCGVAWLFRYQPRLERCVILRRRTRGMLEESLLDIARCQRQVLRWRPPLACPSVMTFRPMDRSGYRAHCTASDEALQSVLICVSRPSGGHHRGRASFRRGAPAAPCGSCVLVVPEGLGQGGGQVVAAARRAPWFPRLAPLRLRRRPLLAPKPSAKTPPFLRCPRDLTCGTRSPFVAKGPPAQGPPDARDDITENCFTCGVGLGRKGRRAATIWHRGATESILRYPCCSGLGFRDCSRRNGCASASLVWIMLGNFVCSSRWKGSLCQRVATHVAKTHAQWRPI